MMSDAPTYEGLIEGLYGEQLYGWCWQVGDDRPVWLQLFIDDRLVTSFEADHPRGDLTAAGIGSGRHGFVSAAVLGNVASDAIIRVKIVGSNIELTHSGYVLSAYEMRGSPRSITFESHIVPQHSEFISIRTTAFPTVSDIATFCASACANLVVEPAGTMRMAPCRVVNRAANGYRLQPSSAFLPDGGFPDALPFPRMTLSTLENAYCLPFAPPLLPARRQIATDFLIPWAPDYAVWFGHAGGDVYHSNVSIDLDDVQDEIEVAFYMDHSISAHFGHFIGDCLCRMYGWEVAQQIYGDVKLIIGSSREPKCFQDELLLAAGAHRNDIIKINGLVRCKRLLLATQSLGVEQYASPTSERLWSVIRDRMAPRDISLPNRIYLTRSGVSVRRLINEAEVEKVFARLGFTIVRPELLSAKQQIALISNALLVAGPSGSGLFNLAFQGRLRSAFILAREDRVQLSEMLFCAGRSCDLWYHLGTAAIPEALPSDPSAWMVDPAALESDVADWVTTSMG